MEKAHIRFYLLDTRTNERGHVVVWSDKCFTRGTVHFRFPKAFSVDKGLEIDYAPAMAYAEEDERRQAEEKKMDETQALRRWYQHLSSIPCVMNVDENEVFEQLFLARSGQPPYDQYPSWGDINLWHEISRNIFDRNPYAYKPSVPDILSVVKRYHTIFTADPSLSRMKYNSLRNVICLVFGPLSDKKGSLTFQDIEALLEKQAILPPTSDVLEMATLQSEVGYSGPLSAQYAEDLRLLPLSGPLSGPLSDKKGSLTFQDIEALLEKQAILPPTSDVLKMEKLQSEVGYSGPLSAQYVEDLRLLPLNDEQKHWLIIQYGPTSDKYIAISKQAPKSRRDFLLYLFREGKPSSNRF
ncbi:hypothetical protein Fmac_031148 [Flemingia macrophylla]|uniref:Uncharacterized protein n=1 Tax=Flemingia macrophylla TaxID=520843 RepID=A0ABD1L192_9FABA